MRAPEDKVKQYFEIHTVGMNSPSRLRGSTGSQNFCLNVFLNPPPRGALYNMYSEIESAVCSADI